MMMIFLCIYDLYGDVLERQSFVYLYSLYNLLMLKLKRLVLVRASKKVIDNTMYFRYYKISLYELISFDKFIELLSDNVIIISLISRIGKVEMMPIDIEIKI